MCFNNGQLHLRMPRQVVHASCLVQKYKSFAPIFSNLLETNLVGRATITGHIIVKTFEMEDQSDDQWPRWSLIWSEQSEETNFYFRKKIHILIWSDWRFEINVLSECHTQNETEKCQKISEKMSIFVTV